MQFQDALRAQYFVRSLEIQLEEITRFFSGDLTFFLTRLCHQLDQILLPVIATEIAQAKELGFLTGNTPEERYHSFFIQDDQFTKPAKDLPQKYPFLFTLLDQTIADTFTNLKQALIRARKETFSNIASVDLITESDKHRGQQVLLFTFDDETKRVYKPRDLMPEKLFNDFVSHLNLEPCYALKAPHILPRSGYGWMEYVPHAPCQSQQDISDFFRRAGVLLAVADTLNFSDGHYENIIASGPYPTIIDGETLFQNYNKKALEEKSILSTGLIQKAHPNQKKMVYYSAFQMDQKELYHVLYPHTQNERTDLLEVHFRCFEKRRFHNLPFIGDQHFYAQDFCTEILEGLEYGYQQIHQNAHTILSDERWWKTLSTTECRTIMNHTVNYAFLLRRIQQPDVCQSKESAINLIKEKLKSTCYTSYEIEDLLAGNIPYFYHHPSQSSVYSGDRKKYAAHFSETSIDQIKRNLHETPTKKIRQASNLVDSYLNTRKKAPKHEASPAA